MLVRGFRRNAGERISAYCTRFRTLAAELKREGIELPPGELGWFLKDRMGLDPIRWQLLETALGGSENYEQVETEALRLFRDLHSADPLHRRSVEQCPLLQRFLNSQHGSSSSGGRSNWQSSGGSLASTFKSFKSNSTAPSSTRSGQPYRKPFQRQAMVSEAVDDFGEALKKKNLFQLMMMLDQELPFLPLRSFFKLRPKCWRQRSRSWRRTRPVIPSS